MESKEQELVRKAIEAFEEKINRKSEEEPLDRHSVIDGGGEALQKLGDDLTKLFKDKITEILKNK